MTTTMINPFDAELVHPASEGNFHLSWRKVTTIGLAIVFTFEALIFYAHVAEDIAPFYAQGFDQIGYTLKERMAFEVNSVP